MSAAGLEIRTLTDGGQPAADIASELAAYFSGARESLEIAIYDFRLGPSTQDAVCGAIAEAKRRGVRIRLAYNDERRAAGIPPPGRIDPAFIASLGVDTKAIPGIPDLMHHKYAIRDREAVWTGSANWTDDSWTREENVIVRVSSAPIAAAYGRDFDELWGTGDVPQTGRVDDGPVTLGTATVRPHFTPGRAKALIHRIAERIAHATRRVRVCSPVISSGAILGTLMGAVREHRVDLTGVVDATQVAEVLAQWNANGQNSWKIAALRTLLTEGRFTGKRSTPWGRDTVHDFMHAKLTVVDDVVFVGSYNLSHSGEMNAEDVLEIDDAALADRLAAFADGVRARYAPVDLH